jgi:hypothetical protein
MKYGDVESYARTATEFTPLSNRATTQATTSRQHLARLPDNITSNPKERLQDIASGRVSISDVSLAEWTQLVTIAMLDEGADHLVIDLEYGGGLYSFFHSIEKIRPPAQTGPIMEYRH